MATLRVPATVPSPSEDADALHQAFAGWGTDENMIITILGHRNAAQRNLIRQAYAEKYGEDLLKSLNDELSQDFLRAITIWILDPTERDALLVNEAVKKWSPTNHVLIEIACARTSTELFRVKQAYHSKYKRSVEEDVAAHAKGSLRKLLVPLISVYRYEGPEVNISVAESEAKILHEMIESKSYEDEELIRILTTRSKTQLAVTFDQYNQTFETSFEKDLEGVAEGHDFVSALWAVACCLVSPDVYFEKILRLSIHRLGTDEEALTRVVATRAEVDMEMIKETYFKKNNTTLVHDVQGDTSGDYKATLLALIAGSDA